MVLKYNLYILYKEIVETALWQTGITCREPRTILFLSAYRPTDDGLLPPLDPTNRRHTYVSHRSRRARENNSSLIIILWILGIDRQKRTMYNIYIYISHLSISIDTWACKFCGSWYYRPPYRVVHFPLSLFHNVTK